MMNFLWTSKTGRKKGSINVPPISNDIAEQSFNGLGGIGIATKHRG
jgi:hypothetical protein